MEMSVWASWLRVVGRFWCVLSPWNGIESTKLPWAISLGVAICFRFWGLLAFLYPFVLFSSLLVCVRLCWHSFCLLIVYTHLMWPCFSFFLFGLRSPNEINNRMPRMPVWCASSNPIRLFLLLVSFLTKRKNKKTFLFILNSRTKAQRGGFRSFSKWERHSEHHRPQKWRLFSPNFFIYRGVLTSCWWAMSSSYDLAHDWMGNPWLCFEDRESVR